MGDGDGEGQGQLRRLPVHGVDVVGVVQGIEGLALGVIGHVLHGDGGAQGPDLHAVPPLALGRGIELAVLGRHVDVALGILRRGDGLRHGVQVLAAVKALLAAVAELLRGDAHPAAAAAAVIGVGIGVHLAGVILRLAAVVHGVAGFIAGVVRHQHLAGGAQLHAGKVHHSLRRAALFALGGGSGGQDLVAGAVQHLDGGDVVVVPGPDDEVAGGQILGGAQHLRGGIVHGEGGAEVSALPQRAGGDQILHLLLRQDAVSLIVLRDGHHADGDLIPLLHAQGGDLAVHGVGGDGVRPTAAGGVVVGAVCLVEEIAQVQLLPILIRDAHGDGRGIADQGDAVLIEGVRAADGRPALGIRALQQVGIAHLEVAAAVLGVLDDEVVGGRIAQVRGRLVPVERVGVGDAVIHAGIRPAAVEAQHRDGVGGGHDALLRGDGLGIDVAFQVSAVGIAAVQLLAEGLRQGDGDLHADGSAALHQNGAGLQILQQEVGVIGGHRAVPVQVRDPVDVRPVPGGVVQDDGGILGVGIAVPVQVAEDALGGRLIDRAVHGVARRGGQGGGGGIQIGDAVLREDALGEEIGGEHVALVRVLQVVDVKMEGIAARAVGIVPQLGLHLAVRPGGGGVLAHGEVAVRPQEGIDVGKAGALLQDRPVGAAVPVQQGLCRGHQQGLGQLPGALPGLFRKARLPDVLRRHGGHAGDLRGRHGGAGHVLIRLPAGHLAVDGVDAAAGGGDLGLHGEAAGDAPGAEGAHGIGLRGLLRAAHRHLGADGDGALVVEGVPLAVLHRSGVGSQDGAVRLGDGDAGSGIGVVRQVHVDGARLVIVDDGADGAGSGGEVALLVEGDAAPGAGQDLALHGVAQGCQVLLRAVAVDEEVLLLPGQGGHGGVLVLGLAVEDHALTGLQVVAGAAHIVHRGNGKGVPGRTGGAGGGHADIRGIEIARGVLAVLHPGAGVAGGHHGHDAALRQLLQDLLVAVLLVAVPAGEARAQGEVHRVAAQDDGVLNGHHVVGLIRAAPGAEDLHGEDLGIRRNALGLDGFQRVGEAAVPIGDKAVGGGNARHMGAMLAAAVIVVGDVQALVDVVEAEGQLLRAVEVGGRVVLALQRFVDVELRQLLLDLGGIQQMEPGKIAVQVLPRRLGVQRQGVEVALLREGLVVRVRAGIDDGDPAAGAGITGGPGRGGAGHFGRGGHVGVRRLFPVHHAGLIALLQQHLGDTGHGGDLLHVAVSHVGGDDVGRQRQVPDHVQLLPVQHLAGDALADGLLLRPELAAVSLRRGALRDALHGVARLQRGGAFQHDADPDQVRVGIRDGCFRLLRLRLREIVSLRLSALRLGEAERLRTGTVRSRGRRKAAQQQCRRQYQRQQTGHKFLPHGDSPFLGILRMATILHVRVISYQEYRKYIP